MACLGSPHFRGRYVIKAERSFVPCTCVLTSTLMNSSESDFALFCDLVNFFPRDNLGKVNGGFFGIFNAKSCLGIFPIQSSTDFSSQSSSMILQIHPVDPWIVPGRRIIRLVSAVTTGSTGWPASNTLCSNSFLCSLTFSSLNFGSGSANKSRFGSLAIKWNPLLPENEIC